MSAVIRRVNEKLQDLCRKYGFHFISNDNIGREFLCDDGIHLLDDGTYIFAGNFVRNVNGLICKLDELDWHNIVDDEQKVHDNSFSIRSKSYHGAETFDSALISDSMGSSDNSIQKTDKANIELSDQCDNNKNKCDLIDQS